MLGPLARHLTSIPLGDGTVAAPTFEPIELGPDPVEGLRTLAARAVAADPAVADIVAPVLDGNALEALA